MCFVKVGELEKIDQLFNVHGRTILQGSQSKKDINLKNHSIIIGSTKQGLCKQKEKKGGRKK
jgi:hypothetical protein